MVRYGVKIGLIIMMSGIAYVLTAEILAQERFYKTNQPIIVIDPGHGGRASGVRGPAGILEKTAVLALAQALASRLEADFRVKLTRTGDYDLALADRTAIANQSQAALLISLHTGGSFLYQTDGMTVFYFARKAKEAPFSEPPPDDLDNLASPHWKSVQERYVIDSKILAFTLQNHFEAVRPDVKIRVQQAPLAVLMGANMPAVLIEAGYLSNPAEEKNLSDPQFRLNIAISIEKALKEYFAKKLP